MSALPEWRPVSSSAIAELWAVFRTDAAAQACRNALVARLLGGGIVFVDSSGSAADAKFQDHVRKHFLPFARDVLDSLLVQGFSGFFVDSRSKIPICVPDGIVSYGVRIDPVNLRRSMHLFRPGTAEPDTRAMFVVDSWPSPSGVPVSSASSFRRAHAFRGMVELNTAIADYTAARPLVYTASDSDKAFDRRHVYRDAFAAAEGASRHTLILRDVAEFGGGGAGIAEAHERTKEMLAGMNDAAREGAADHEKALRRAGEQQQRLAADLNAGRLDPRSVRLDPTSGLPVFDSSLSRSREDGYNVIPLPLDTTVQATIAPTSRRDLVPILTTTTQTACMSFGMPAAALGLPGTGHASERESARETVRTTTARYRMIIEDALKLCFVAMYGAKNGLSVSFPSCDTSYEEMAELFEKDVVTYSAYQKSLVDNGVCSLKDLEKRDPRLAREERAARGSAVKRQRGA